MAFEILKVKKSNGVRQYSLRVGDDVLCVPETWTDRCIYGTPPVESETGAPFDARHLAELSELLKSIKSFSETEAKTIDKSNN